MELLVERTCKDCGSPLPPGREDKQYCDDACRTNFNNKKRRDLQKSELTLAKQDELSVPEYIARIQEIILNNRSLMVPLCDEEHPGKIRMRDLLGRGFNPKFFTSEAEPTGSGNVYRFCFEYGYRECDDGTAIVICRPREIY
jgi:predicted nucleic acid-binding Zn ribbon protein